MEVGRQVFWLTARDGPRTVFPRMHLKSGELAVTYAFGGLTDYSGGPATDSHRFPYSPTPSFARRGGHLSMCIKLSAATMKSSGDKKRQRRGRGGGRENQSAKRSGDVLSPKGATYDSLG